MTKRVAIWVTTIAMLIGGSITVATPAGAADDSDTSLTARIVDGNRSEIVAMYRDHLGRRPTSSELRRYNERLGVTLTEKELRATLLGTREFYVSSGHTFAKFVTGLSIELRGTRSNRTELRELRRIYNRAAGTTLAKRRAVAKHLLSITGYDGDGFRANRVEVERDDSGMIEEITVRVNQPVTDNTGDLLVSIRGQTVSGDVAVHHRGRTLSLRPDVDLRTAGRVVATVLDDGVAGTMRADRATMLAPLHAPIFPNVRVVANYGNHQTSLMGVLGETGPEAAAARVKAAAAPFSEPGRPAVGAFEMIVTVAQASPGADGNYSAPSRIEDLRPWIDVAAREGLYVILDIQPGRSDFLKESKRYRELLLEPHVGLALDPEWRMKPHQRPGQVVGQVSAAEINQVSEWLSELVLENGLPEKMFIIHQFQTRMITDRHLLVDRPGLATIIHADGFGGRAIKLDTYRAIQVGPPLWNGFKLFIDEDTWMFRPADVLAFTGVPVPDLITYQ